MTRYFIVFKNSLQEYFTYRLNFILWRVRVILSILISFFLWQAIFTEKTSVFGYNQTQMLTYVILLTFINGIVLSTQTPRVAEEISLGRLSNFLIRPMNYFGYVLARDVSDKAINTFFSLIEIPLFIVILRPPVLIQTNPGWLLLFFLSTFLAALLYFEISLILSCIGFWSREVWAPRFVFFILVAFLSGTYFPLDIFPKPIYSILEFLPFSYLVFFPLKLYLGTASISFLIKGFTFILFWIVSLRFILAFLWRTGLKQYTSEGQ